MGKPVDSINRELGRKKLMMKLPQFRSQLKDASGSAIDKLFIAYQSAAATRDRMRAQKGAPLEWHADYDKLFEGLEDDVSAYFAKR
jgi:hypothetical protein